MSSHMSACPTTLSPGKRLGGYLCNAWVTSLAYDEEAQYAFIGDPPTLSSPESSRIRQNPQELSRIPWNPPESPSPGDYSGAITVCHLEQQGLKFINTLKGHNGSVRTLAWDGTRCTPDT